MVLVEAVVLISRPFVQIALQLVRPGQRRIVLYLHEDLIQRGIQGCEVNNPPRQRSRSPIVPLIACLSRFSSFVWTGIVMSFSFL